MRIKFFSFFIKESKKIKLLEKEKEDNKLKLLNWVLMWIKKST